MRKYSLFCIVIASCGSETSSVEVALPSADTALCVTLGADYRNNVGTVAVVGLPSLTVLKEMAPSAVSGDPVLRAFGDRLYVVNRSENNVTIIDPTRSPWTVESQFGTGANSNPQDVALAGDRAYVPLYNKSEVQVWDISKPNPTAPVATIDLGASDVDGVPNANSIVVAGGKAYVTLDLLDTEMYPKPRGNGKVAVIDTATNQLETTLELRYSNPYDFMFPRGDKLVVATFADFSGFSGCLEQISVGAAPAVGDCLVENADLMGTVNSIAVAPTDLYIAVSSFGPPPDYEATGQLRRIHADGTLASGSLTPATQLPTDVAYAPSGHIVYADRQGGGVRVLEAASGHELTTAPLDIGLSPVLANGIACFAR